MCLWAEKTKYCFMNFKNLRINDMPRKNSNGDKNVKLVQFKVSRKTYEELERIKEDTGSLTVSEVIRDSLKLYTWAMGMRKNGHSLFSVPENGEGKKFEVILVGSEN